MQERLIEERKSCPNCQKLAELTGWLPPKGIDPRMREYKCPDCPERFYQIARFSRFIEGGLVPLQ